MTHHVTIRPVHKARTVRYRGACSCGWKTGNRRKPYIARLAGLAHLIEVQQTPGREAP